MAYDPNYGMQQRAQANLEAVRGLPPTSIERLQERGYKTVRALLQSSIGEVASASGLSLIEAAFILSFCFLYILFESDEYQRLKEKLAAELSDVDSVQETFARLRIFQNRILGESRAIKSPSMEDWLFSSLESFQQELRSFEYPQHSASFHDGLRDHYDRSRDFYNRYRRSPAMEEKTAIEHYKALAVELGQSYSRLSVGDAITQRGLANFIPVVFSIIWITWELLVRAPRLIQMTDLFVSTANAATAANGDFTPPLGLSQTIFTVIVCLFAVLLLFLIIALTWAGFFAPKKSVKAATIVEHFGSLLLGVFFGTKL